MVSPARWLFRQFRFVAIARHIDTSRPLRVLDIGCGELSPKLTREELPGCEYHSLDLKSVEEIRERHGDEVAARYHRIDLEASGLEPLAGAQFDLVVMSHVLEHLENGLDVLRQAVALVAPGGAIYVEYPRLASVNFPCMDGTLNFHDDRTHKRVYCLVDVANTMLAGGLLVRAARVRRQWRRVFLLPAGVVFSLIKHGKLRAGVFWDVMGFAEYAIGVRPAS